MDNFQIEPDFENKKFNGIIKAWGHFSIGVVGVYILQIYMKDEVHAVIDKFSWQEVFICQKIEKPQMIY